MVAVPRRERQLSSACSSASVTVHATTVRSGEWTWSLFAMAQAIRIRHTCVAVGMPCEKGAAGRSAGFTLVDHVSLSAGAPAAGAPWYGCPDRRSKGYQWQRSASRSSRPASASGCAACRWPRHPAVGSGWLSLCFRCAAGRRGNPSSALPVCGTAFSDELLRRPAWDGGQGRCRRAPRCEH